MTNTIAAIPFVMAGSCFLGCMRLVESLAEVCRPGTERRVDITPLLERFEAAAFTNIDSNGPMRARSAVLHFKS
jgi:hypothetical protein